MPTTGTLKNPGLTDYDEIYKSILSGHPGYQQGGSQAGGGSDAYDAAARRFEGAYEQASSFDPSKAQGIAADLSQALSQIKAGEDVAANKAGIYYSGERLGKIEDIGAEAVGAAESRLAGLGETDEGPRPMPVASGVDLASAVRGARESRQKEITGLREQARMSAEAKAAEMRAEQEYRMLEQRDENFRGAMGGLRDMYGEAVRRGSKDEQAKLWNLATRAGGQAFAKYALTRKQGAGEESGGQSANAATGAQVGDTVYNAGQFEGMSSAEAADYMNQAYPGVSTPDGMSYPSMYDIETATPTQYSLPGAEGGAGAGAEGAAEGGAASGGYGAADVAGGVSIASSLYNLYNAYFGKNKDVEGAKSEAAAQAGVVGAGAAAGSAAGTGALAGAGAAGGVVGIIGLVRYLDSIRRAREARRRAGEVTDAASSFEDDPQGYDRFMGAARQYYDPARRGDIGYGDSVLVKNFLKQNPSAAKELLGDQYGARVEEYNQNAPGGIRAESEGDLAFALARTKEEKDLAAQNMEAARNPEAERSNYNPGYTSAEEEWVYFNSLVDSEIQGAMMGNPEMDQSAYDEMATAARDRARQRFRDQYGKEPPG